MTASRRLHRPGVSGVVYDALTLETSAEDGRRDLFSARLEPTCFTAGRSEAG
jgi:hypothetical protein